MCILQVLTLHLCVCYANKQWMSLYKLIEHVTHMYIVIVRKGVLNKYLLTVYKTTDLKV